MSELLWKSALELRDMIRSKEISPVEVVTASLERLREVEPKINAFLDITEDQAMDAAKVAEAAVTAGDELGPLHGLPVSVKDLIAVQGARLTFGSRAMADNVSDVDAPSVARIRAAGGAIVGKSTTSEFGCKGVGDSPLTGITRNPWNLGKTPGGSSCGAAASIASGVTPFGLGTDGGGSVRIPSSFTGLFGIKGHFGRVPVFPASATPTLAGKTPSQHEFLFFEYRNWSGVRGGRWKIVRGDPNSDFELYDLRTDWSETNNLAAEKPKIRNALAKAFDDWRNNVQP